MINTNENFAWLPDCIYTGRRFEHDLVLVCDDAGRITRLARKDEVSCSVLRLKNRALLPGMINAHSHAFQRVIRGKTEHRSNNSKDSFWTWREMMYSAAQRLDAEDIYDASRMAFLEMALGGITSVGEFHYLHQDPNGAPYQDPNLLAKQVIRAAGSVGLRIALLRVAYARSGYRLDANESQKRFIERESSVYLRNLDQLKSDVARDFDTNDVWVGLAPHSVRAVPLDYLREVIDYGNREQLKVHMHVAEQTAENDACVAEHGRSVVTLLADENMLSERFTCVHAVHITNDEAIKIAGERAIVCACPTTERNLGDGIVPADILLSYGVRVAFGTDSHTQIDLLEEARQLEYNLRLVKLERNVLAPVALPPEQPERGALAARLFDSATLHGASSIGASGGLLEPGSPADFYTVDLNDPSIVGASPDDLLSNIIFSLTRAAVRDVFVGGRQIVEDGKHTEQHEIVEHFTAVQHRLWG